ncbi:MAG: hypothetical protein K0R59_45 [Sphingobacterium sp.]|nr:hypothetical protein [Sphingobacterium sp.]
MEEAARTTCFSGLILPNGDTKISLLIRKLKIYTAVRYSKETKRDVIDGIVKGELWLEEAMVKYAINDRRVIISWLRKYQGEQIKTMTEQTDESECKKKK